MGSYFGLAFTFLAVTGEVIRLSQPVVAVICWIEEVYVADEQLQVQITHKHTQHMGILISAHFSDSLPENSWPTGFVMTMPYT